MPTGNIPNTNFNNLKGIRQNNGINSGGMMSALEATNVELFKYGVADYTGIRTMKGNEEFLAIDPSFSIVNAFKSNQDGVDYMFIHAENSTKGVVYKVESDKALTLLVDDMTLTGNSNAITMQITAYDVLVITTGEEIYQVSISKPITTLTGTFTTIGTAVTGVGTAFDTEFKAGDSLYSTSNDESVVIISIASATSMTIKKAFSSDVTVSESVKKDEKIGQIFAIDNQGRTIKGLSLCVYRGSLVIASKNIGVSASREGDITIWDDLGTNDGDSWYEEFYKGTTAVVDYIDSLLVFTKEDSTVLIGVPTGTAATTYQRTSSSLGGCASYSSLLKHDIYLFFYDSNQKNLYYYLQNDYGQKRLGEPIATEINDFLTATFERCKLYSCIYNDRNEIWMLFNDDILIFDYRNKEWVKRDSQGINSVFLLDGEIYSASDSNKIYLERTGRTFDGEFKTSEYATNFINFGSDSNLKKQKTPILLSLDQDYNNNFWIEITVDGRVKGEKNITIDTNDTLIWGDDTVDQDVSNTWDLSVWAGSNLYDAIVVKITPPQIWYKMQLKIYTKEAREDFAIQSIEFKNIRMKTKTCGR